MVSVWMLNDEERRESLLREGEALRMAYWFNYAMNDPKQLQNESRRYDQKLSVGPHGRSRDDAGTQSAALQDALSQLRAVGRG